MGDSSQRVVVIGAGVAGLATAALLVREDLDVTVVDKIDAVGGRAGSLNSDDTPGFRWDTGPSWYLMPDAFDHFYRLCGTSSDEQLELVDLDPAYRLFDGQGTPIDVPAGREAAAALFESIETGAGAALLEYLDGAKEIYEIAVDRFLYTNFNSLGPLLHRDVTRRLGRLITLLSRSLESFVNEHFQDARLRQILTYPAVFLSSSPARTPAMYHLMSHTDLTQGVRYPIGGFTAVIESLHRLAVDGGVKIVLNAEVTSITTTSSGRSATTTGVRVRYPDGTDGHLSADIVVSGADLHHTENHLLPAHLRTYPEKYWAKRNPGIGCVLVMLGVKGRLAQLEHHNLLFSPDWTDDFAVVFDGPQATRPLNASMSLYVSMPSATDPDVAPPEHENLFILIPTPASAHLGHGDAYGAEQSAGVDKIAEAAIDQISLWADIPDLRERIVAMKTVGPADFLQRYHSWRGGAIGPAHTLAQSAFLRGRNRSAKVDNLYYAGATTVPGVGVPMCLISAENVLKRVRGDRSAGPLPEVGDRDV